MVTLSKIPLSGFWRSPAVCFLIAANIIPIIGVLFWQWDVGIILGLYWLETVIIGVLNVPKMLLSQGPIALKLFTVPFFIVHFGMFCYGHFVFLKAIFNIQDKLQIGFENDGLKYTLAALGLSHLFSMAINFIGKKEYKTRAINQQMFMPYSRIFVLHFVIILGGGLTEMLGQPIIALVLLVTLKIGLDIVVHLKSHSIFNTTKMELAD